MFRNSVCSLPLAEQLLHVTLSTWRNLVLPISCMFPVLTRSGSLVPSFPYTARIKLRTKNQDGLVLPSLWCWAHRGSLQALKCSGLSLCCPESLDEPLWVLQNIQESTARRSRLDHRRAFSRSHLVWTLPWQKDAVSLVSVHLLPAPVKDIRTSQEYQWRISGQGMCACVPGKKLQCYEFPPKKLSILVNFLLKLTNYLHSWNGLFGF